MLRLNSLFKSLAVGAGSLGLCALASAQSAIDPGPIDTVITNNEATITTIGGTILGLVVLIAAYRWVRRIIR